LDLLEFRRTGVNKIIEGAKIEEDRKRISTKVMSEAPTLSSSFYLDAIVNIESSIKKAQTRIWQALKAKSEFTSPFCKVLRNDMISKPANQVTNLYHSIFPLTVFAISSLGATRYTLSKHF
jgi:hypothetical protein